MWGEGMQPSHWDQPSTWNQGVLLTKTEHAVTWVLLLAVPQHSPDIRKTSVPEVLSLWSGNNSFLPHPWAGQPFGQGSHLAAALQVRVHSGSPGPRQGSRHSTRGWWAGLLPVLPLLQLSPCTSGLQPPCQWYLQGATATGVAGPTKGEWNRFSSPSFYP